MGYVQLEIPVQCEVVLAVLTHLQKEKSAKRPPTLPSDFTSTTAESGWNSLTQGTS